MSSIVGVALDDLVGAVLTKKDDAGFLAQVDKEFLDTEIRLLKERVEQYRLQEVEHGHTKGKLDAKLSEELANQKDIFMYLNGELAKKTDEILELQVRMQTLQDDSERQALEHDSRMLAQKDAAALQSHKLELDIKSYK